MGVSCLESKARLHPTDAGRRHSLGNNLLLTHARAVALYRNRFKEHQRGVIGITLVRGSRLPVHH